MRVRGLYYYYLIFSVDQFSLTVSALGWASLYFNEDLVISDNTKAYYASEQNGDVVTLIALKDHIPANTAVIVKAEPRKIRKVKKSKGQKVKKTKSHKDKKSFRRFLGCLAQSCLGRFVNRNYLACEQKSQGKVLIC